MLPELASTPTAAEIGIFARPNQKACRREDESKASI